MDTAEYVTSLGELGDLACSVLDSWMAAVRPGSLSPSESAAVLRSVVALESVLLVAGLLVALVSVVEAVAEAVPVVTPLVASVWPSLTLPWVVGSLLLLLLLLLPWVVGSLSLLLALVSEPPLEPWVAPADPPVLSPQPSVSARLIGSV